MDINLTVPVPVADLGAVTISNASPAVVGKASHGLAAGTPFYFTTTGALPAGAVVGKRYYVRTALLNANDFTFSEEGAAGPAVNTTDAGSGTHTGVVEALRVDVSDFRIFGLEVKNLGAQALDVFSAFARFGSQGNWISVTSLGTDYTNAVYPVKKASASPVTLASGASAWVFWDVEGIKELSIRASSAVAGVNLEFHGVGKLMIN